MQCRIGSLVTCVMLLVGQSPAAERPPLATVLELDPTDVSSITPSQLIEFCSYYLVKEKPAVETDICKLLVLRGQAFGRLAKTAEALRDFDEVLRRAPNDSHAGFARARELVVQGRLDAALSQIDALLRDSPNATKVLTLKATILIKLRRWQLAMSLCDQAIKVAPDEPDAYLYRVMANVPLGRMQQAFEDCNSCIRLGYGLGTPLAAIPICLRGDIFLAKNEVAHAMRDYEMAVGLDPRLIPARHGMWACYLLRGKYAIAGYLGRRLAREFDDNPYASIPLVVSLLHEGKRDEAQQLADRLLVQDSDSSLILLTRGHVNHARGDYEAALLDYETALSMNPGHSQIEGSLAFLLATCPEKKIRDGKRAVALAKRGCERTREHNPRFLMLLAMAHAECGEVEEAARVAKRAIEKLGRGAPLEKEYKRRIKAIIEKGPVHLKPESGALDYLLF